MLSDFFAAIRDVFRPAVRKILFFSALATGAAWVSLLYGCWRAVAFLADFDTGWLTAAVRVLGFLAAFAASLLILPSLACAFSGLFSDGVLKALGTDDSRYAFRSAPLKETARAGLRAFFKNTAAAVVFTPLCWAVGLIPVVNVFSFVLYYAATGGAYAYEYFFATALCFVDENEAAALFSRHKKRLKRAGMLIAVLMTFPVANVFAPVVATAFMRRVFFKLDKEM